MATSLHSVVVADSGEVGWRHHFESGSRAGRGSRVWVGSQVSSRVASGARVPGSTQVSDFDPGASWAGGLDLVIDLVQKKLRATGVARVFLLHSLTHGINSCGSKIPD
jgi:hypothetical protein